MRPPFSSVRREFAACSVLAALCLGIFWQTTGFDFINFDDNSYVSQNRFVKAGLSPGSAAAAFSETFNGHWHPFTMLSYMLDSSLFGTGPGGYHLTNLCLHIVNTLLLFLLLSDMTGAFGKSLAVAALFAVHPLHVEPVAWIASRKDLLSTFFLILALFAYTAYARHGGPRRYFLVAVWLVAGLLSKAMLVTLPLLFLALDVWPLGRYDTLPDRSLGAYLRRARALVVEKIPFFGIVALVAGVTVLTQARAGTMSSFADLSFPARLANAVEAYGIYLVKALWPVQLAPFYPHSGEHIALGAVAGSLALLTAITCGALAFSRRAPYLLTGWAWFVITLLPVSGLMQAGIQAYADRYTYVPLIGLSIAAVWAVGEVSVRRSALRLAVSAAAVLLVAVLAAGSWRQASRWRDDVTLFEHTLSVTENNYVAHMILGNAYQLRGRTDDAIAQYRAGLAIEPNDAATYAAMAVALVSHGKYDGAISHYETALALQPGFELARANYAALLLTVGRSDEAIAQFQRVLERDPDATLALNGLALAMAQRKDFDAAALLLRHGLHVDPSNPSLHKDLGLVLAQAGAVTDSRAHFERAVALAPNDPDAHNNLAILLAETGHHEMAITHFNEALRLNPEHPTVRANLERCLASKAAIDQVP